MSLIISKKSKRKVKMISKPVRNF